jgi:hypothetical protein
MYPVLRRRKSPGALTNRLSPMPHAVEIAAAVVFAIALIYTFTAARIEMFANGFPRHTGHFHVLGEVEVVFGFWAPVPFLTIWALAGSPAAIRYLEEHEFTELLLVFVIMVVSASRPIFGTVSAAVQRFSVLAPIRAEVSAVRHALCAIPLLGSRLFLVLLVLDAHQAVAFPFLGFHACV